jgi:hypothetical protein
VIFVRFSQMAIIEDLTKKISFNHNLVHPKVLYENDLIYFNNGARLMS